MSKQNKWLYLLFILSCINWLPTLNVAFDFIYLGLFTIVAWFVTPVLAIIYILATLVSMLGKTKNWLLWIIIIAINMTYLVWGYRYLQFVRYMT